MLRTVDASYGSDIDGNRGTTTVEYELTSEDTQEVRDQIFRLLEEDEYEYTESMHIYLMCDYTEEMIEFSIEIAEYMTKVEFDNEQKEFQCKK